MDAQPKRAIVIGASMAGLLAARVLAEHFDEVLVLERDELPSEPGPRKGTPHAVHPHGLLARGHQVLEQLFPGFTDALVAQGGLLGDIGQTVAIDASRRRFARSPLGVNALAVSRLAIEAELRRRVRAMPRVRLVTGAHVVAPMYRSGRVDGVTWECAEQAQPQVSDAALVIDCSGRGSHSPSWLSGWDYPAPAEERVTVGVAYSSAYFVRELERPPLVAVIGTATAELPCPAVLIAQEPASPDGPPRWVLTVGGYAGDHVPPTREAIAERARSIEAHEIAALAEQGTLVGQPMRYGFPFSLRRHYEKLRRFPAGYLVMGDALASFNPIYGQGMTVAACEALALQQVLRDGLQADSWRRFFTLAARIVDTPWQLAVGGDLALPQVQGPRPLPVRVVNAYVARVQRAAVHDPVVAAAFVRVMHMLEAPPSLFAPQVMWRVWRAGRQAAEMVATAQAA